MTSKNPDLHGSAPDKSPVAVLLIDVINGFDFPEAKQLLRYAKPMAERIAELLLPAGRKGSQVRGFAHLTGSEPRKISG